MHHIFGVHKVPNCRVHRVHFHKLSSLILKITTAGQIEQKSESPMPIALQIRMKGCFGLKQEPAGRHYGVCYSLTMCVAKKNRM